MTGYMDLKVYLLQLQRRNNMNVLMIGNVVSVGWNLTKGLRKNGIDVVFVDNENICTSGKSDYNMSWDDFLGKGYGKGDFDIVHIHAPNFKKLGLVWRYLNDDTKLICHWHGSDLRIFRKTFPVSRLLKKIADYHLYSTIDLAWWLRNVENTKKQHFRCPVDTDLFKPYGNKRDGLLVLSGGARTVDPLMHDDMPEYMNSFDYLDVTPAYDLSKKLLPVSMLEGGACGLYVLNHHWLTRSWVVANASIESQTKKLLDIYNGVLKK